MNIDALTPYINYLNGVELTWCHQTMINAIKLHKAAKNEHITLDELIKQTEYVYGITILYLAAGGRPDETYNDQMDEIVIDGIKNYYPESRPMFGNDLDESYPEVPQQEEDEGAFDFKVWIQFFKREGFTLDEIYQMTFRGMVEYAVGVQEDIIEAL